MLKTTSPPSNEPPVVEEEEEPESEADEVVLVAKVQNDGTIERIVFTSGAEVDVFELERLCTKVNVISMRLFVSSKSFRTTTSASVMFLLMCMYMKIYLPTMK